MFFLICATDYFKKINLSKSYENIEKLNVMLSHQSQKNDLNNTENYIKIYRNIQKYVQDYLAQKPPQKPDFLEEFTNIITNIIFIFTIANEILDNFPNEKPKVIKVKEDLEIKLQRISEINSNLSKFLGNLKIANTEEFDLKNTIKYLRNLFLNSLSTNSDAQYLTKNLFQLCAIEKKLPHVKSKFSNKKFKKGGKLPIQFLKIIKNIENKKSYSDEEIKDTTKYLKEKYSLNHDINIGIHLFSNNNREIQHRIRKSEEISFNKIIIITSIVLVSVLTPTFLLIYKKLK